VLGVLGGAAIIAGVFLPVYGAIGTDETVKLFDNSEKATVWLIVEPIVLGLVPALLVLAALARRTGSETVWLVLLLLGVQALLLALGHLGFSIFSDVLTPEIAGFLFLAGGAIVAAAGVIASPPRLS
jgi:hypothetical protein